MAGRDTSPCIIMFLQLMWMRGRCQTIHIFVGRGRDLICRGAKQSATISWCKLHLNTSIFEISCSGNWLFPIQRQSENDPKCAISTPNVWNPAVIWWKAQQHNVNTIVILLGDSSTKTREIRRPYNDTMCAERTWIFVVHKASLTETRVSYRS